jgi:hypothetical protein
MLRLTLSFFAAAAIAFASYSTFGGTLSAVRQLKTIAVVTAHAHGGHAVSTSRTPAISSPG